MESVAKIRRMYHVEGMKIKEIARKLGISKNTVKKIIKGDISKLEFAKHEKQKPILGDYMEKLNTMLEDNLKEPVRRRLTAKRIFEKLTQEGYSGSYESVNLIVREFRRVREAKGKQVFIPLSFAPGEAFQFDWGEEEVKIGGIITRVKAARIKLCYSRFSLVVVFPNERLEMMVAAHDEAFKFFKGCAKRGIYDNMATAVSKILIGKDRKYNETFLHMASHYLFEPTACTPAAGWEKGRVEKLVGDTRRNFFTPIMAGKDYADINHQLITMSIESAQKTKHPDFSDRLVYDVFLEEQALLIPYRGTFTSYKLQSSMVLPNSTVIYDSNNYSVECAYVGLSVQIQAFAWEIVILYQSNIIGKHRRLFTKGQYIYDVWHYVPALSRKPGALRNGAPFQNLMTSLPTIFTQIRNHLGCDNKADKEFVKILQLINKYDLDRVEKACHQAVAVGGHSADIIEKYLLPPSETKLLEYPQLKNPPDDDCSKYSILLLSKGGNA